MRLADANYASLVANEYYYAQSSGGGSLACAGYLDPSYCHGQSTSTTTTQVSWDAYLKLSGVRTQSMSWETVGPFMRLAGVFLFPFFALATAAVRLEGVRAASRLAAAPLPYPTLSALLCVSSFQSCFVRAELHDNYGSRAAQRAQRVQPDERLVERRRRAAADRLRGLAVRVGALLELRAGALSPFAAASRSFHCSVGSLKRAARALLRADAAAGRRDAAVPVAPAPHGVLPLPEFERAARERGSGRRLDVQSSRAAGRTHRDANRHHRARHQRQSRGARRRRVLPNATRPEGARSNALLHCTVKCTRKKAIMHMAYWEAGVILHSFGQKFWPLSNLKV